MYAARTARLKKAAERRWLSEGNGRAREPRLVAWGTRRAPNPVEGPVDRQHCSDSTHATQERVGARGRKIKKKKSSTAEDFDL